MSSVFISIRRSRRHECSSSRRLRGDEPAYEYEYRIVLLPVVACYWPGMLTGVLVLLHSWSFNLPTQAGSRTAAPAAPADFGKSTLVLSRVWASLLVLVRVRHYTVPVLYEYE